MPEIKTYEATIEFENELVAGIPGILREEDGEIGETARNTIRAWQKQQSGEVPTEEMIDSRVALLEAEDQSDSRGRVFMRYDGRPVIETRQVKAMLKEASSRLGYSVNAKKNPGRQHLQHDVEVFGIDHRFYIDLGGSDPEVREVVIHKITPQGPRSAIDTFECITSRPRITFRVKVLRGLSAVNNTPINEDILREILETAGTFQGLGASRTQGYGRFFVVDVKEVK